ncbi:unnamed protein product [Effrenium voratum]|nr:unnamed protein product [Effrenium voratum]
MVWRVAALALLECVDLAVAETAKDGDASMKELRAQLEDERRSRQVQEAAAVEAINNVTAQMRKRREVETELTSTRSKLQKVLDELAAEKLEVKDLKGSLQTQGTGPLTVWLLSSHWQWTIASLAAAVGAFGVFGADGLVIAFHSFMGCLVTGLLVAGCLDFIFGNVFGAGISWLDSNAELLNGAGSYTAYIVWLLVTCFSLFRWRSKVPVILFAQVDTLHLNTAGEISEEEGHHQPLLEADSLDEVPLPPAPPPSVPPPTVAPPPLPTTTTGSGI